MITAMQLCDDGKTLAVSGTTPGSSTAPIVLIDTTTRKAVAMLQQAGDTVMCMTLNHAGTQLAVGTYDGMLSLWDMKKHDVLKAFPQQASAVSDIAFDDKDAWLANCNRAGQIEVFETTEGFPSKLRTTVSDAALALLFEDGKTTNLAVAVGGSKEQSVRLINAKNTKSARKLGNTPQMPLDLCWAPTSRMAYLAGSDGSIVSWKRMGQIEKTFKGHTDYVTAICLSPDEKLLASVSLDGTAKIWDASQGLLLATLVQIKPRADTWLFITGQGTFNASSPDVVSFFNQPDATQDALRRQWLLPQQVSEHLGMTTK
jgi:WD40 repeat protein